MHTKYDEERTQSSSDVPHMTETLLTQTGYQALLLPFA